MSKFGPRFARQKDTSHKSIVDGLRAAGIVVFDVSALPSLGFDILCYQPECDFFSDFGEEKDNRSPHPAKWQPFEIKNPEPVTRSYTSLKRNLQPKETRQLTASEVKARSKAPIPCIRTVEEALSYF